MKTRIKITDTTCKNAQPDTKQWDAQIGGFALWAGKRRKTFYFQKDVAGKTQRTRLGCYPELTVPEARKLALKLASAHANNVAPTPVVGAPTLREAMAAYLARPSLTSEGHKVNVRGDTRNHLGDWLDRPIDEITKAMCAQRHGKLRLGRNGKLHPVRANNALRHFRTIYRHALRTYDLPPNPTLSIEWFPERPNPKIIDDLPAWLGRVTAVSNPIHRAFFKLLLLSGLRRTECASLTWEQIHDDHIHLPMTKNGRAFDLPIQAEHLEILSAMRGLDPVYVFPAMRGDTGHLREPQRLITEDGLITCHMHRRTFATMADTSGMFPEMVGRLLNHTPTTVTGTRYVVVDYRRLREPMSQVIDAFRAAVPALFG